MGMEVGVGIYHGFAGGRRNLLQLRGWRLDIGLRRVSDWEGTRRRGLEGPGSGLVKGRLRWRAGRALRYSLT